MDDPAEWRIEFSIFNGGNVCGVLITPILKLLKKGFLVVFLRTDSYLVVPKESLMEKVDELLR